LEAGLAGIGAVLSPVIMAVLGVLFMYGSFKQEKETKKVGLPDVLS